MPGSLRNARHGFGEGQLRVGDAERDAALAALREHYADGRLDADELDERLAAALLARTRSDLDRLFWDLPGERRALAPTWPPAPRRNAAGPWRLAGRVLGAATASAVLVGVIVTILLATLVVTMLTFGGFLWLLVFWWLLARGFGWSCSGRRRQVYRQHPGYWQRPGRITRV